jgi:hypothetical protein
MFVGGSHVADCQGFETKRLVLVAWRRLRSQDGWFLARGRGSWRLIRWRAHDG